MNRTPRQIVDSIKDYFMLAEPQFDIKVTVIDPANRWIKIDIKEKPPMFAIKDYL